MIAKVISGGQTGADQGGLHAAQRYDIPTGGFCPKDFRTVFGPQRDLARFGLIETVSGSYQPRTKRNAEMGDATVRFATDFFSAGEKLTKRYCKEFNKPVFDFDLKVHEGKQCADLIAFIREHDVKILNVAGNADRDVPFGKHFMLTRTMLCYVFAHL